MQLTDSVMQHNPFKDFGASVKQVARIYDGGQKMIIGKLFA